VNADVLKVRRPLLQDENDDALEATQSASSEAQQTASDQQLLKPVPATDAHASSLGKFSFFCVC